MQFHEVHVQSECFQIMFLYWAYNSLVLKKAFLQILNDGTQVHHLKLGIY